LWRKDNDFLMACILAANAILLYCLKINYPMKRILFILLISVTTSQLRAQQATFKQVYKPKTSYSFNNNMKMHMDMTPQTTNADANKPMVMDMNMDMQSTIATGSRTKNNDIPVKFGTKMSNMDFTMNGNKIPMGNNMPATEMQMFGRYTPDGKLELDSVAGKKLTDSVKTAMTTMMTNIQNYIKFPEHPLKVGESFTLDAPFNMPMPGLIDDNSKMNVKTTYTLLSVTNNIAVFDFTQNMDINLTNASQKQGMQMVMKGTGNGKMNFDTKLQFLNSMTDTINMSMDMNVSGNNVKIKAALTTDVKVVAVTTN
jgi:hypothetical protein